MLRRFPIVCSLVALVGSVTVAVLTVGAMSPANAASATDWKIVTAGYYHTCAIRGTGKLYCWGRDDNGQLGNGSGSNADVASPQQITSATDWKTVTARNAHTCAIRGTGKLYCWGDDFYGQLGNGSSSNADVVSPQQITSATDWKTVTAGHFHTCATRSSGKLYCWGYDAHGQLGNGADGPTTSPTQITAATDWKTVAAGYFHTCATRGKLYCWGYDAHGQVGNGGSIPGPDVASPQQITTATDWTTVSSGGDQTCAIRGTGKLYCWGFDYYGQLGNGSGSNADVVSPQQITSATDWETTSTALDHTCATRGKLYCWGYDGYGQVGNGSASSDDVVSPQQITSATDWKTGSSGSFHSCAIRSIGKLYCWGRDNYGQLGNGAGGDTTSPTQI